MAITSGFRSDASGAYVSMNWDHAIIHKGELFAVVDIDADVDIAGPKYWHFKTPVSTSEYYHLDFEVSCDGGALVELFEAPTITGNGSTLAALNHNRNSSKTTDISAYYDATTSDDGTRLSVYEIGSGGGGPNNAPGKRSRDNEFILKADTSYIIKVTTRQDNSNVSLLANLYSYDYTDLTS
jgi:hypothetical protein